MSGSMENEELYRGMLSKCGGKVKTWNKRAMSLKSDYCLYYYKDGSKKHQGLISLRDPKFTVRRGEKVDCSWPKAVDMNNTLVVVTTPRTYYMFADNAAEAQEWQEQLANAHMRMIEGLTMQRKTKAHTAPSVGTDQPGGGGSAGVASSVPKRFQKNNRQKVTKRFQGDEDSSDHDAEGENVELDDDDESTAARSSSISAPGEGKSEGSLGRSASHSGAPKRYKKKDRHMPTPRFQQAEEEDEGEGIKEEDGLLMDMSMEDLRETSSLTKSSDEAVMEVAYEAVTIISKTGNYKEASGPATLSGSATNKQQLNAASAPGPTTLIYDEIPGEKGDVLYEDLEIKGTTAGKSPTQPMASVHPSPKLFPRDGHVMPVSKPMVPVEESLYNGSTVPSLYPDAVYDLIGYNPEENIPPARPNKPAPTSTQQCHSEETFYDVVKTDSLEHFANKNQGLSPADLSTQSPTEGAMLPVTANNTVLKTDSPPPLPRRNPSMADDDAPPLPTREPLKPAPGSQSPKMSKNGSNVPSEKDADMSQNPFPLSSSVSPFPLSSSDRLASSIPNSASLVSSSDNAIDSSKPTDTPSRAPFATPTPHLPISTPRSPIPLRSPRSPVPPRSPQSRVMADKMPAAQSATGGEVVDAFIFIAQQPPSAQQSSFQLDPPGSATEDRVDVHLKDLQKAEPDTRLDSQPDTDQEQKTIGAHSHTMALNEASRPEETSQRSPQTDLVSRVPACTDPEEPLSPRGSSVEGGHGNQDPEEPLSPRGSSVERGHGNQDPEEPLSPRGSSVERGHGNQESKCVELKDLNLFLRQQKRFAERDTTLVAEREINIQVLKTVLSDTSLTSDKKAAFGELLREIEQQKQEASEERYKWERERMKFESERQKFEEEKRQFQEEMERLRANAQK